QENEWHMPTGPVSPVRPIAIPASGFALPADRWARRKAACPPGASRADCRESLSSLAGSKASAATKALDLDRSMLTPTENRPRIGFSKIDKPARFRICRRRYGRPSSRSDYSDLQE